MTRMLLQTGVHH